MITIPEPDYLKFLHLHGYPGHFKIELAKKAKILKSEQKKISRLIQMHTTDTRKALKQFTQKFKTFRNVKLPTRAEFLKDVKDDNKTYVLTTLENLANDGLGLHDEDTIWDSKMVLE